jgi:hypothetical protein
MPWNALRTILQARHQQKVPKRERERGEYSSVIPVAAPHTMLNTVNTSSASRIINLIPKISLNFA